MLLELINIIIPVFIGVVLHEIAHGYAALKLGDDTAYRCGRLSLDPRNHVDVVGTLLVPLFLWQINSPFLFGWAKPVPVNFGRLRNRRRDMVIVASAGIVVNALLAFLAWVILVSYPNSFCFNLLIINLALIFLNILPFPPLDGSKIFFGWINRDWARKYVAAEKQGMIILLICIVVLPIVFHGSGISGFDPIGKYMDFMFDMVLGD